MCIGIIIILVVIIFVGILRTLTENTEGNVHHGGTSWRTRNSRSIANDTSLGTAKRNSSSQTDGRAQNAPSTLPCSILTRHVLDARLLNPTGETTLHITAWQKRRPPEDTRRRNDVA